jgi:AraC family transcriptional regulator
MPSAKPETKPRLEAAMLVDGPPQLIAGLRQHYTAETRVEIPALWKRFGASVGQVPRRVSEVSYGICLQLPSEDMKSFEYVAGIEVRDVSSLPAGWSSLRIPALRYAVFPHREHVSRLSDTIDAIFHDWLPGSGFAPAQGIGDAPGFVERYGTTFDPDRGTGDLEVWVPIKAKAKR